MAVPNTTTFTLQDVTTEIYGNNNSGKNLNQCFADANGTFDSNYVGGKNSLYNFRNYQNVNIISSKFGYLYNGYAKSSSNNLAPAGWHIPTESEWETLKLYLSNNCGGLKSTISYNAIDTIGWAFPNTGASNSTGFSALPAGTWLYTGNRFNGVNYKSHFWSNSNNEYYLSNDNYSMYDSKPNGLDYRMGLSIRLIKDDSINTGFMSDYDGNFYSTIKIGNQVWMSSNLRTTHFSNGVLIPLITNNTNSTNPARYQVNNDPSTVV